MLLMGEDVAFIMLDLVHHVVSFQGRSSIHSNGSLSDPNDDKPYDYFIPCVTSLSFADMIRYVI